MESQQQQPACLGTGMLRAGQAANDAVTLLLLPDTLFIAGCAAGGMVTSLTGDSDKVHLNMQWGGSYAGDPGWEVAAEPVVTERPSLSVGRHHRGKHA